MKILSNPKTVAIFAAGALTGLAAPKAIDLGQAVIAQHEQTVLTDKFVGFMMRSIDLSVSKAMELGLEKFENLQGPLAELPKQNLTFHKDKSGQVFICEDRFDDFVERYKGQSDCPSDVAKLGRLKTDGFNMPIFADHAIFKVVGVLDRFSTDSQRAKFGSNGSLKVFLSANGGTIYYGEPVFKSRILQDGFNHTRVAELHAGLVQAADLPAYEVKHARAALEYAKEAGEDPKKIAKVEQRLSEIKPQ